jgi:tetratricopeptide (TPR) repeat protein
LLRIERLRQAYPLSRGAKVTAAEKAAADLHAALEKVGDPQASAQRLEQATHLVLTGGVPVSALHGEILHLVEIKSPALPQMLSATLMLEERNPGALPLQTMFFLSSFYLLDTTTPELQTRFLTSAVNAVRLNLSAPSSDPADRSWAVQLLRRTLPSMQKLTPGLYATASAQLAAAAPDVPQGEDVFGRIRNSSDPLSQAITEANFASDARLKSQLFEMAARLAKEQGKLRQAVELLSSVEEDRRGLPESYSHRDELFDAVSQEALKRGEVETARLAASKMDLPTNRAAALRRIARYLSKSGDAPAALRALGEATDALEAAKDGKEKAISYFELATDFAGLDDARALASIRDGIKAANNIPAPAKQEKQPGASSWSLFPLADSAIKAFRVLASRDRGGALGLAETFQPKEFRVAATVGVYSAAP